MAYIIFNQQCGVVIYGGTMLPGCGKKHTNLSAGSPFEVRSLWQTMSKICMTAVVVRYRN